MKAVYCAWRAVGTLAKTVPVGREIPLAVLRAPTNNPVELSIKNEAQWYFLEDDVYKTLHVEKMLPNLYRKQVETFQECAFMVRRPLLDTVNCVQQTKPDTAVVRYVVYGKYGTGKTMTLCQIAHYAHGQNFIVCHMPFADTFASHFKEVAASSWKEGRIDMPLEAVALLQSFKSRNERLLKELNLKTSKRYVWGARDCTEADQPLCDVVDIGISRPKFACDCLGVLLKELKDHASQKRCKVMVLVDCVNSFWGDTRAKRSDKSLVNGRDVSIFHSFKKMLKNDWTNGAVVVSVDSRQFTLEEAVSHKPFALLGKEAFEWLDPFVPIEIPNYSEKEGLSVLGYLFAKHWIHHPKARTPEGIKQLMHLSGFNPGNLLSLCRSL